MLTRMVSTRQSVAMSVRVLETPDKSPADRKDYRAIRLGNGLTALLISDLGGDEEFADSPYPVTA